MTQEEKRRYSRQIAVESIGQEGQKKIMSSKVIIIGCGALGSMVAMQLSGAGVGKICIADFDTIDISNLQRQFFFKTEETGLSKSHVLASRIKDLNPLCDVEELPFLMTPKRARECFGEYDYIVDATDNPDSKSMVEDICSDLGKVCCIAGVNEFHGQVMTIVPDGYKFGELFPDVKGADLLPCSIGGVVGPAVGVAASIQASEVIKYLSGTGDILQGKVFTFNLLDNTFHTFCL